MATIAVLWRRPSDDRGTLYTTPIAIAAAPHIQAKAIRYGYAESPTVSYP